MKNIGCDIAFWNLPFSKSKLDRVAVSKRSLPHKKQIIYIFVKKAVAGKEPFTFCTGPCAK